MPYDALVFDNDGVLTMPTPMDLVRTAIHNTFVEFGVDPSEDDVSGALNGSLTHLRRVCRNHDVDVDAFWTRREARAAAIQREALEDGRKPLYDDFDALYNLDADLGVVSNNQHETVEHVVEVFGLQDLFRTTYGREPTVAGLRRKKPTPYYLKRALADLDADRALYVGDSNVDVIAATRAGVDSAFIRRPHRADYPLAAEPTHEIDSLYDLDGLA
ncbi:MAG: HAD family hydrolase [Halobacteriota archaeon]